MAFERNSQRGPPLPPTLPLLPPPLPQLPQGPAMPFSERCRAEMLGRGTGERWEDAAEDKGGG